MHFFKPIKENKYPKTLFFERNSSQIFNSRESKISPKTYTEFETKTKLIS